GKSLSEPPLDGTTRDRADSYDCFEGRADQAAGSTIAWPRLSAPPFPCTQTRAVIAAPQRRSNPFGITMSPNHPSPSRWPRSVAPCSGEVSKLEALDINGPACLINSPGAKHGGNCWGQIGEGARK